MVDNVRNKMYDHFYSEAFIWCFLCFVISRDKNSSPVELVEMRLRGTAVTIGPSAVYLSHGSKVALYTVINNNQRQRRVYNYIDSKSCPQILSFTICRSVVHFYIVLDEYIKITSKGKLIIAYLFLHSVFLWKKKGLL